MISKFKDELTSLLYKENGKDLIFLDYLIKASSSSSKEELKAVLGLFFYANIINEVELNKILSSSSLGVKNKEELITELGKEDIMFAYEALPPLLKNSILVPKYSQKLETLIKKTTRKSYWYLLLRKMIQKSINKELTSNRLTEMEKEIEKINQKVVSLNNNIKESIKKDINQKIDKIEVKVDHLSRSSTEILSSFEELSVSIKEAKSYDFPIPYIISLSLSTAVTIFCGTSLYINIFTAKTLFDPYLSLFWFLGGLGIGLMSLKGIFSWGNK